MTGAKDSYFRASDGCKIAYTLHNAASGGTHRMVLVHSLALDRSVWDGVVERLGDDVAILTYDCRGHGRSEPRAGDYTPALFARDLSELLEHVGWFNATIVGCSMGGCAALAFAGLYGPRANALGLIDTTAWYGAEAPKQFRERAATARKKGMSGLIEFQLTRWFSDGFRAGHSDVLERLTGIFTATDLECYAASCALLGDADLRPYLASFRKPVAIVVGEEDVATPPAMSQQLHEALRGSTLTVIPGGRHLTPIEYPDRIAAELRDLIARH